MICQVSDGRRGGLKKGVAARCRASGREVFAGESEAPERPMEGRHERVRKRQVFLATFCDFLGFFGRQHGGVAGCVCRGTLRGLSGSRIRLAARSSPPASRRRLKRGGDEAAAKILEMVNWNGDGIVREDRGRRRGGNVRRSAAVWLEADASSSWHAVSVLPATARSKQPDRVNPGYRFWQFHPQSGPKLHQRGG